MAHERGEVRTAELTAVGIPRCYLSRMCDEGLLVKAGYGRYRAAVKAAGYGEITTEIRPTSEAPFFYAEGYHQQYLSKNPMGYCGIGGTGVSCPVGLAG